MVAALILLVAFGSAGREGCRSAMALFGLAVGVSSMPLLGRSSTSRVWAPVIGGDGRAGRGHRLRAVRPDPAPGVPRRGRRRSRSRWAGRWPPPGRRSSSPAAPSSWRSSGWPSPGPVRHRGWRRRSPSVVLVMVLRLDHAAAGAARAGRASDPDAAAARPSGAGGARATPGRAAVLRWSRWGEHVTRHAAAYAVGGTVLLLALAAPVLALRLGFPDEGTLPAGADRAAGLRPGRAGLRARRQRAAGRRRRRLAATRPWSAPLCRRGARRPGHRRRSRRPGGRDVRRRGRSIAVADDGTAGRRDARDDRPAAHRGAARRARGQPGAGARRRLDGDHVADLGAARRGTAADVHRRGRG